MLAPIKYRVVIVMPSSSTVEFDSYCSCKHGDEMVEVIILVRCLHLLRFRFRFRFRVRG